MTKQELERHLYNYKKYKLEINSKQLDIEQITAGNYASIGHVIGERTSKTNRISDPTLRAVEESEKAAERLRAEIRYKEYWVKKIDIALTGINERQQEIIKLRYFSKLSDTLIADRLCYSRTTITRNRNDALKTMLIILSVGY